MEDRPVVAGWRHRVREQGEGAQRGQACPCEDLSVGTAGTVPLASQCPSESCRSASSLPCVSVSYGGSRPASRALAGEDGRGLRTTRKSMVTSDLPGSALWGALLHKFLRGVLGGSPGYRRSGGIPPYPLFSALAGCQSALYRDLCVRGGAGWVAAPPWAGLASGSLMGWVW